MRIIIIKLWFWHQFSLRLLKNRRVLRSMVTCFGIILGQHLCGVNMMIFYALMLFETTGSGELTGSEQTLVVGAVQILVCLLAAFLVDVLGRRILLTVSSLFMGLFLILLGKPFSSNKCFDGKFLRPNIPRLLILINRFDVSFQPDNFRIWNVEKLSNGIFRFSCISQWQLGNTTYPFLKRDFTYRY